MTSILRTFSFFFFLVGSWASAATYVADFQKVSLRSAPSATDAIIKMIPTDTRVTVLETQGEWAKIKVEEGVEGWVHTRGLSQDTPVRQKLAYAEKKLEEARTDASQKDQGVKGVSKERDDLKTALVAKEKELETLRQEFQALTTASADVVKLQKDYKSAAMQVNDYYVKNQQLEEKLGQQSLFWFLAGAGVLLVGMLLGRNARKNNYSSSLRF